MNTRFTLIVLLFTLPFFARAETTLQNGAMVQYNRVSSDRLALDIRPVDATPIDRISAQLDGISLPVSASSTQSAAQQVTAILFLVDTSDPGRQQAISNTIQHINQLLSFEQSHYRYSLARFDTDLHFLTPMGVSAETVQQATDQLQAVGKTTELYRNTLGAIKQLSRYPADRKFLFLLSDGRAEDRAYFHRDVVKSAVKNHISIYTIGYADTISLTVALQTLRRLSEDTGGQYLSTEPGTYRLDDERLQRMFDAINMGARYQVDLSPALQAGLGGSQEIMLSVMSGSSLRQINLPLKLPVAIMPAARSPTTIAAPAATEATAPQVIIERVPTTAGSTRTIEAHWLLLIVGLLLVGIIIYLAIRLRDHFPGKASTTVSPLPEQTADAYAWLEIADDSGASPRRYPIRSTETKIGRYRGNDVALHDSAISRYHAEIHFTDDGRFVISDMGSKNGLLINDQEVLEQTLENDDLIEIGDVRLRFVIPENLAEDLQDTQMFRTQFPGRKNHA
jgi:Mg-chelatase subunit ChlD